MAGVSDEIPAMIIGTGANLWMKKIFDQRAAYGWGDAAVTKEDQLTVHDIQWACCEFRKVWKPVAHRLRRSLRQTAVKQVAQAPVLLPHSSASSVSLPAESGNAQKTQKTPPQPVKSDKDIEPGKKRKVEDLPVALQTTVRKIQKKLQKDSDFEINGQSVYDLHNDTEWARAQESFWRHTKGEDVAAYNAARDLTSHHAKRQAVADFLRAFV